MNTVEQYLEDSVRLNPDPRCYTAHNFVYFHGAEFKPCADHRRYFRSYGGAGLCFRNTLKLVRKFPSDLTYAEGFAASLFEGQIRPHFGLHAWAVTREGEAVDPTWPDGTEYFGIPFDLDYVIKTNVMRKEFGVIDNYQEDFPLLAGAETDWRPEWDMARPFREGFIPYPRREGA
jgi:hypothetical protein